MDSPLCVKGCGFYGSVENNNICSKCYREFLKQQIAATTIPNPPSSPPPPPSPSSSVPESSAATDGAEEHKKEKKRCKKCNKKVGLLGFYCRCKDVFCGAHRHPEDHCCTVNLVTIGRQLLVSQNPTIKGDKLDGRV